MLVAQLAWLIVPFVLLRPLTNTDYLVTAATNSSQIKLAVFLLLANSALTVGIAVAAQPVFRRRSEALSLLLLAAGVIMFSLQAVDNAHLMTRVLKAQIITSALSLTVLPAPLVNAQDSTKRATKDLPSGQVKLKVDPLLIAEAAKVWALIASPNNPA